MEMLRGPQQQQQLLTVPVPTEKIPIKQELLNFILYAWAPMRFFCIFYRHQHNTVCTMYIICHLFSHMHSISSFDQHHCVSIK